VSYDDFTRTLYVLAALLEAGGVLLVVWDVRRDRNRAREYLGLPRRVRIPWPRATWTIQHALEDEDIRRGSHLGQMIQRERSDQAARDLQRVALRAAEAEVEFRQTIADILRGNVYRRLVPAVLIAAGIALGTYANFRAL